MGFEDLERIAGKAGEGQVRVRVRLQVDVDSISGRRRRPDCVR